MFLRLTEDSFSAGESQELLKEADLEAVEDDIPIVCQNFNIDIDDSDLVDSNEKSSEKEENPAEKQSAPTEAAAAAAAPTDLGEN